MNMRLMNSILMRKNLTKEMNKKSENVTLKWFKKCRNKTRITELSHFNTRLLPRLLLLFMKIVIIKMGLFNKTFIGRMKLKNVNQQAEAPWFNQMMRQAQENLKKKKNLEKRMVILRKMNLKKKTKLRANLNKKEGPPQQENASKWRTTGSKIWRPGITATTRNDWPRVI